MKFGLILGIVGAVFVHILILLFGGIFFMHDDDGAVKTREVALLSETEAEKKKDEKPKDDKGNVLSEQDIKLFKRYGKGAYNDALKKVEDEIKVLNQKITEMSGIKESDTGLAAPAQWNLAQDKQMMQREKSLMVGRCTQIINPGT